MSVKLRFTVRDGYELRATFNVNDFAPTLGPAVVRFTVIVKAPVLELTAVVAYE